MFTNALISAVQDFKAGTIDFSAYKARLEVEMDKVVAQSDTDKARAFDAIFERVRAGLTEQDEPYESNYKSEQGKMWYSSDETHYVWEATMTAIFGDEFFDFYNEAYTGG